MTGRVFALLAVSSFVGGSAGEPLSMRVPAISLSIISGNAQTTTPEKPQGHHRRPRLQLLPNSLTITVGATGALTATLSPMPTGGATLSVSSDSTIAKSPTSVSFLRGESSVAVPVLGVAAGNARVTVSLSGSSASSTVQVTDQPSPISFSPASYTVTAGTTGLLSVTLSEAAAAPTTVTLAGTPATLLSLPASVTIPTGQTGASFDFTALVPGTGQITAILNAATATCSITVTP
jgi:carbon monoxide dehydrogenase subunit G